MNFDAEMGFSGVSTQAHSKNSAVEASERELPFFMTVAAARLC